MWIYLLLLAFAAGTPIVPMENTGDNRLIDDKMEINEESTTIEEITFTTEATEEPEISTAKNRTRFSGRELVPAMEMLDPKRYPKPKKPMGNDIGVARGLDIYVDQGPKGISSTGIPPNLKAQDKGRAVSKKAPDHFEATISIGYTMAAPDQKPKKEMESSEISREMQQLMEVFPKMPKLFFPNLEFQKDPEEEAINQRITEVARQLAENTMRKEAEKKNVVSPTPIHKKKTDEKTGKSFLNANSLPLVSHFPAESAQLQLIAEVQAIPQVMVSEGFPPQTPPPELIGPLLGGPPLKESTSDAVVRIRRSQEDNLIEDAPKLLFITITSHENGSKVRARAERIQSFITSAASSKTM